MNETDICPSLCTHAAYQVGTIILAVVGGIEHGLRLDCANIVRFSANEMLHSAREMHKLECEHMTSYVEADVRDCG